MFSYMGRKQKIIDRYPKPQYGRLIETFAGSAPYAMKWWSLDVTLIDKYPIIIKIWKYLQQAQPHDILSLPSVVNGEKIPNVELLCDEERWLIGFCINNGSVQPKKTAGSGNYNSWERDKFRIANDLYKIRHWKFVLGEYNCLDNISATWFIDPPYQNNIKYPYHARVDNYTNLGQWCQSRKGQVIVCEKQDADWLDFQPLVSTSGQRGKQNEVIWYKSTIDG